MPVTQTYKLADGRDLVLTFDANGVESVTINGEAVKPPLGAVTTLDLRRANVSVKVATIGGYTITSVNPDTEALRLTADGVRQGNWIDRLAIARGGEAFAIQSLELTPMIDAVGGSWSAQFASGGWSVPVRLEPMVGGRRVTLPINLPAVRSVLINFPATDYTLHAVTVSASASEPEPQPAKGEQVAPIVTAGIVATSDWDGGGRTYQHKPDAATPLWSSLLKPDAPGITIGNATLATAPGAYFGLNITQPGVTARNLRFADRGGNLVKIAADNVTLRDVSAETFVDYAVFGENADNFTIELLKVRGGSTKESVLRFSRCRGGRIIDADIDYTTETRKACLRGDWQGEVIRGRFVGAVTGVGKLVEMNGGQAVGWYEFRLKGGYTVTASNPLECEAAVRAWLVDHPDETLGAVEAALRVVKVNSKTVAIAPGDALLTLAQRKAQLAERGDVTFTDTVVDFGLRVTAGGRVRFRGGKIIGSGGSLFPLTTIAQYPEPRWLLPGDEPAPPPVIELDGVELVGNFNLPRDAVAMSNCTHRAA